MATAKKGPTGRKRSPLPSERNPKLARKGGWDRFTPEERRELCARGGRAGNRTGVPDGTRRAEIEKNRESGQRKAKRLVELMVEKYNIEDQHAVEALEYAVTVIKTPKEPTRDKLAAARLVLDFCKTKPTTKSEVTIKSAEELLAALEAEDAASSE